MSKKIWRGTFYPSANGEPCVWESGKSDCTVVPDSALFPVKEARAYINAIEDGWKAQETNDPATDWEAESLKVINARSAYLRAKERMRKKASRKS